MKSRPIRDPERILCSSFIVKNEKRFRVHKLQISKLEIDAKRTRKTASIQAGI